MLEKYRPNLGNFGTQYHTHKHTIGEGSGLLAGALSPLGSDCRDLEYRSCKDCRDCRDCRDFFDCGGFHANGPTSICATPCERRGRDCSSYGCWTGEGRSGVRGSGPAPAGPGRGPGRPGQGAGTGPAERAGDRAGRAARGAKARGTGPEVRQAVTYEGRGGVIGGNQGTG